MKRILILFSILVGVLLVGGIVFLFAESGIGDRSSLNPPNPPYQGEEEVGNRSSLLPLSYPSKLTSEKQVYDGDTLKDVRIQILDMGSGLIIPRTSRELWPGVFLTPQATIEVETDVRINGIDTPEKRPLKKRRDGTFRSEKSRANEKYAAAQSRLALLRLLKDNALEFTVSDPKIGKYAGRIVAGVKVDGVDAAQFLIENGNALPYDGGRKVELDWDNLSDGVMR